MRLRAVKDDGSESFLSNMVQNDDRDHDGLTDEEETALGTNLNNPDSDADGLKDGEEYIRGTNPLLADTDGDGYSDALEVQIGSDPLDINSTPIPAAPNLTSPIGTITTQTPMFTWNAATMATQYHFALYDYITGQTSYTLYTVAQANCDSGQDQCTIAQIIPLSAGNYRWWVQAKNTAGTGPWSSGLTFAITTTAPTAPVQSIPSGTINSQTPTYTWNAVGGTAQYQITFYDYTTAQYTYTWYTAAEAHCEAGQAHCTISQSTPLSEGGYRWWVKGQNVWGTGPTVQGRPSRYFLVQYLEHRYRYHRVG